jgi:glucokinase
MLRLTGPAVTIGVDLGGTATRVVALDDRGAITSRNVYPTPPTRSGTAVATLTDVISDVAAGRPIAGVGIGASGPVTVDGIIRNPATLPAFTDIDLCAEITARLDRPCVIDNDAAVAALGEYTYGAGRGSTTAVTVTLGTGIGVAVITDGKLLRAADGTHPEAGHIAVRESPTTCYCGLPRCWEQAASRTALDGIVGGDLAIAAAAARAGDDRAIRAFERYGQNLAAGLGTLLTLFRPDRVILGGSAARYLDLFAGALSSALTRAPDYRWTPPVVEAELGDLAGAIGAAILGRPIAIGLRAR